MKHRLTESAAVAANRSEPRRGRKDCKGFCPVLRNGHADCCWQDRLIGTRIAPTKCASSCARSRHVLNMLAERHAMMDRARNMCSGTGLCGSH